MQKNALCSLFKNKFGKKGEDLGNATGISKDSVTK
jgi:hypothetical protein